MGSKYQAEQRVEHVAIACAPDLIRPTPKDPPLPFITYAEFDTAVNVAVTALANQHPAFVSVSKVPKCKGGPPGGKGIKSGTWDGQFVPTEWSDTVQAGPGWQVYHGHKGTINNGNTEAEVITAVGSGEPTSPCIAALKVQFERLKRKAAAEMSADPWQFTKDMGSGAWGTIEGYGDTAVGLWDGIKSVAGAVWNDPIGSAERAAKAIDAGVRAAGNAVQQVVGLGKAIIGSELTVDDVVNGLEDLVSEVGAEAACALAKMLEETNDAPGGVGEAVGGLATEVGIQVALALATGGGGNAAAAGAKTAKAGKYLGKGVDLGADTAAKLKAMGIKEGDDLKTIFKRLKEHRAKGKPNKPDTSPRKADRNPDPPAGGHSGDTHNKANGKGDADKPCPVCPGVGGPVNPIQGCKVLSDDEDLDFVLPGLLPLHWQRSYASNNPNVSWYGQGWSVPFTLHLRLKDGGSAVDFIDAFGRVIAFPGVAPGREFVSASENISLRRDGPLSYSIVASDGSRLVFEQAVGSLLLCTALQDAQGRSHRIYYRKAASATTLPEPRHILAQGGQVLELVFGVAGLHAGQPARRLLEVRQIGNASSEPSNPIHTVLSEQLDAQASFDTRWQLLHDRLLQDKLPTNPGAITLVRYDYSLDADLVAVHLSDAVGQMSQSPRRRFAWQHHLLVQHDRPDGWSHHYTYDRPDYQGKVLHHWQLIHQPGVADAPTVRLDWHFEYGSSSTCVVQAVDSDHARSTIYHFDARQRWTGTTDALGNRTRLELNDDGHVKAVVDPAGRRTSYLLDGRGRPLQITNANGERTTVQWHATLERPLAITNALGGTERFVLDAFGNLLASTDALGRTTRFVLDARGLPSEIHDAKGGIKRLRHDEWGQLTEYIDCSGQATQLVYDAWGHLAGVRNALDQTTFYQHDRDGRLLQVQHPDGSRERFDYDPQGRLVAHEDGARQVTRWELAADGLPLRRVDALGHRLQYRYDVHRRVAKLVNENGDHYAFTFDVLDRLSAEQTFDGKRSHYEYDPAGHLRRQLELGDEQATAADLIETRFERDAVGRLLAKQLKARTAALISTQFAYDANGALVDARNEHCRISLRYDAAGQLIEEQTTAPGLVPPGLQIPKQSAGRQHTLRHRYDELGHRVSTTLPDGRVLNMLMYGNGHVHQLNIDGQVISDIERDALHRETARTQGPLRSTRQYDAMGRLKSQVVQRIDAGGAVTLSGTGAISRTTRDGAAIQRHYRYDTAGQLSQLMDWRHNVHYGYDVLGQLLSANEERFAFDPAHNLLPAGNTGGAGSHGRVERNRLRVFEDQRFDYDVHGRLVTKRSGTRTLLQLHWSAEHQLERSMLLRPGQPPVHTGYAYDPFGRRLYKSPLDEQGRLVAYAATWFVWDGNRLLQELKTLQDVAGSAALSLTQTYVYEPDSFVPLAQLRAVATLAEAGNSPTPPLRTPLQRTTTSATSSAPDDSVQLRYFHCDQIGTPKELTTRDGRIAWQATYRAWGNSVTVQWEAREGYGASAANAALWLESDNDLSDLQPLRFQGQYFDVETGLHYNRFRYYDPATGRYATHDPIGLWGGENTHLYAQNPTGWIDPFGLNKSPGKCANCDEIECKLIEARLKAHVATAQGQLAIGANSSRNGLSPNQARHVMQGNPWAYAMHYGTQLDSTVKSLVRADPMLMGRIHIPTGGPRRPDFINNNKGNKTCKWFDLTTEKGWAAHVSRYGPNGRHISYSAPSRGSW